METVFIYLAKSTAILLLFYVVYFFLLKKETFFSSNRWFLLLGIFSSIAIPFLAFKKIVWVEPVKTTFKNIDFNSVAMTNFETMNVEESSFSWEMLLVLIYGIGVIIFFSKLIIEFYSLRKIIKHKTKNSLDGFAFIEVDEAVSPFSFFKTIVYNPTLFQAEELDNIIKHEKIHAKQNHSVDVLMTRIYCILFWWNPLVWMYKKAIIQNLEFIADNEALALANDKKTYLLTLLKITTAERHVAITNHFYQSLIKKRIVMLNKNQSKKHHSWKYFIVIPVLVLFIITYQVKVIAQEKQTTTVSDNQKLALIELEITPKTSNEELEETKMLFNQEFGTLLEFTKIKRNKQGEIASIKVAMKQKNSKSDIKTVYEVLGDTPIKSFKVYVGADKNGKVEFGYGEPSRMFPFEEEKTDKLKETTVEISDANEILSSIINNKTIDYKKAYISLNEKEITPSELLKIDPLQISNTSISNGKKDEKLEKKYGPKAVHGVILINTLDFQGPYVLKDGKITHEVIQKNKTVKQESKTSEIYYKTSDSKDNISIIKEDKNTDYTKAYISLNGKEITPREMEKIDPNSIESVSTINSPNKEKLVAKYGEKAKNGVILIETIGFKKTNSEENKWKVSTETFNLDKENGGFTIHKRSQKSDFEFIQKELEKIGLLAKFSGIERNKEGLITSIEIKLIDIDKNVKKNLTTNFPNPNGISDISIGRKNGKMILAPQ